MQQIPAFRRYGGHIGAEGDVADAESEDIEGAVSEPDGQDRESQQAEGLSR